MVIWLNGAFGAGKTQTAYELYRRLPDSFVYDPENAGYFMRANLPEVCKGIDCQDYPMWRSVMESMSATLSCPRRRRRFASGSESGWSGKTAGRSSRLRAASARLRRILHRRK